MSKLISMEEMFGLPKVDQEIVLIPIDELVIRKDHKWKYMSEDKLELFDASIRDMGILQPIIVRPKKDIPYDIDGEYEVLVGNTRTSRAKVLGLEKVPGIVKENLSEEEAAVYVNYSNIQRDWNDMPYSVRAAVIADAYHVQEKRGTKDSIFDEINNLIKIGANPVESTVEGMEGHNVPFNRRDAVAEQNDLSPRTISRYIRIDLLHDEIKELLDDNDLAFAPAVQISYISEDNQKLFAELMRSENHFKCNEEKAKQIRELDEKKKLTVATMTEVLLGTKKKPGKPKGHSISHKIVSQYFVNGESAKEMDAIIEEGLKWYFANH